MITYFTDEHLFHRSKAMFLRGDIEVYDITPKDLARSVKQCLYDAKKNGNSVVFSFKGRNKILIFGGSRKLAKTNNNS